MIKFSIQTIITILVSLMLFELMGAMIYIGLVGLWFFVVLGVMYARHGVIENDENAPTLTWLGATTLMAAVFAVFWAVLPLAWAWTDVINAKRKRDAEQDADRGEPGDRAS